MKTVGGQSIRERPHLAKIPTCEEKMLQEFSAHEKQEKKLLKFVSRLQNSIQSSELNLEALAT